MEGGGYEVVDVRQALGSVLTRRREVVVAAAVLVLVGGLLLILGMTPELWVDNPGRKASSLRWRTSVALADTAVLLLVCTLLYGSLRSLAGKRPARHLPWRRTIGVAGGLTALAHLTVGLSVHGDLAQPWESFFVAWPSASQPIPLLFGKRGFANWVGAVVATLLVGLISISNRTWLRRLGGSRWKNAQRSTYLVFGLVGVHAFYYWQVEQRLLLHRLIITGIMGMTIVLQLAAVTRVSPGSAKGLQD